MRELVRAELMKLQTTRTPWGLLFATLCFVALTVSVSVPKVGDETVPLPLSDPGVLAGTVATGFGVPLLVVVLLGGIAVTQEYRYGTVTQTYLGEPRRVRILLAKWLAVALLSAFLTLATLVLAVPLSVILIEGRGAEAVLDTGFWGTVAAAFLVMLGYGTIGVALGALLRNQIVTVVGVLVWMTALEYTVIGALPSVARWLPIGANNSVLQMGPALGLEDTLLPVAAGVLLLLGYVAVAAGLAVRLTPRRDVI